MILSGISPRPDSTPTEVSIFTPHTRTEMPERNPELGLFTEKLSVKCVLLLEFLNNLIEINKQLIKIEKTYC